MLRYGYECLFRFTTDTGDVTVPMRFTLASDDAPVLPSPHMYGSSVWGYPENRYGEIPGTRRWAQFEPAKRLRSGRTAHGSAEQLAGLAPVELVERVIDGEFLLLQECVNDIATVAGLPLDLGDKCNVGLLTALLWAVYHQSPSTFASTVQGLFGLVADVLPLTPTDSLQPRAYVIHTKPGWIILVEGTTNAAQFLGQAMASFFAPTGAGATTGNSLTIDVARTYYGQIESIIGGSAEPRLYAGHSYGGSVAQLLASFAIENRGLANVSLATFGSPREIGASTALVLHNTLLWRDIVRQQDGVPFLPPRSPTLLAWFPILAPLYAFTWSRYVSKPVREVIQGCDSYEAILEDIVTDDLLYLLQAWITAASLTCRSPMLTRSRLT